MTDNFRATPRPDYSKASFTDPRRFSNQISITSESGVGGTTLFKRLKKTFDGLPYRFVSGGALMRVRGNELDMTIEQFAQYNHEHPEDKHDSWCDTTVETFGRQNYVVGEGRLPHVFMPYAFHVLLVCRIQVRASRRAAESRKEITSVWIELEKRDTDDNLRYQNMYSGCLWNPSDFNLVLDTANISKDEIERQVLFSHREQCIKWKNENRLVEGIILPP